MSTRDAAARFSLHDRVALVTGAARGLGLTYATALADSGAHVVLTSRNPADAGRVTDELVGRGLTASSLALDVVDANSVRSAIEATVETHGGVDIVVNNAGISHRAPLVEQSDADWQRVIDVNLTAAFRLARSVAPAMRARGGGRIVNVSSILASHALADRPAYVASKAGVDGLTRALAMELASDAITVNAIAPGYFETDMTAPLRADPEFDGWIRRRVPLGRWGDPSELAGALLLLVSDAGRFITGQTLHVDGGMSIAF